MSLPDCPHCAVPIGEGSCLGCRNVRGQEVDDAHDALDFAPVDAEWIASKLGEDWRDSLSLRGLVVLADRALAANPLSRAAVDRLMSECAPSERENVGRFRFMLALGAATRGGIGDELARLEVLLADERVSLPGLAQYLADLARVEWAQTSALLLPDPDSLPHWLRKDV